jgi:hypothetical protein
MGIETLHNAAHAAGFAMAAPEEAYEDLIAEPGFGRSALPMEAQWQPTRAVLINEAPNDRADWAGFLLALFGRRAPRRRAVLTAEA